MSSTTSPNSPLERQGRSINQSKTVPNSRYQSRAGSPSPTPGHSRRSSFSQTDKPAQPHVLITDKVPTEVTVIDRYTGFTSKNAAKQFAAQLTNLLGSVEQGHRGFISMSFHYAIDGSELLTYSQWETIEDFHLFGYDMHTGIAKVELNKLLHKLGGKYEGQQTYKVEKLVLGHSKLLYEEPKSPDQQLVKEVEKNETMIEKHESAIDPITHLPRRKSIDLDGGISEWPRDWPSY